MIPPAQGATAPTISLRDAYGTPATLAALRGRPVVLVFFRGHWCPYCRRYLTKLQEHLPRLAEFGAEIVAISPEPPATSRDLSRQLGLSFPILHDSGGAAMDAYGVRNGFARSVSAGLPHAAVFVIDRDGVVRLASVDRNYKKRTTVRTILRALQSLS